MAGAVVIEAFHWTICVFGKVIPTKAALLVTVLLIVDSMLVSMVKTRRLPFEYLLIKRRGIGMNKKSVILKIIIVFSVSFLWAAIGKAEPGVRLSKGQTVYVPVYSHIYSGNRENPFYLAVTISIRNTDPRNSITITTADYRDSNGKVLRRYIQTPIRLNPFSATRYVIKESDKSGGSGASFIVKWVSGQEVNPPIIESVMITTQSQQGISFSSRGQVIKEE